MMKVVQSSAAKSKAKLQNDASKQQDCTTFLSFSIQSRGTRQATISHCKQAPNHEQRRHRNSLFLLSCVTEQWKEPPESLFSVCLKLPRQLQAQAGAYNMDKAQTTNRLNSNRKEIRCRHHSCRRDSKRHGKKHLPGPLSSAGRYRKQSCNRAV